MSRPHPTGGTIVTSGFRTRLRPDHDGTDFRAPVGTPLYASQSGTVRTGTGHPRAGTWVEIVNGNTVIGYSHLSKRNVTSGQSVKAGDIIGWSGQTGNVTGPHLHFYVKIAGVFVDPVKWLDTGVAPPNPSQPTTRKKAKMLHFYIKDPAAPMGVRYTILMPDGRRIDYVSPTPDFPNGIAANIGNAVLTDENLLGSFQTQLRASGPALTANIDIDPTALAKANAVEHFNEAARRLQP